MALDKDLASIQEARELVNNAFSAWQTWSRASQEQVDRVCAAMAEAAFGAAERLGRMAHEETGYGVRRTRSSRTNSPRAMFGKASGTSKPWASSAGMMPVRSSDRLADGRWWQH